MQTEASYLVLFDWLKTLVLSVNFNHKIEYSTGRIWSSIVERYHSKKKKNQIFPKSPTLKNELFFFPPKALYSLSSSLFTGNGLAKSLRYVVGNPDKEVKCVCLSLL